MTGYILLPRDLSVVQAVNVTDYTLPLECFAGETGSVTFEGKGSRDFTNYVFRFPDRETLWKITSSETGDAQTTKLSVTDETGVLDGAFFNAHFANSYYNNYLTLAVLKGIVGNYNNDPYTPNFTPYAQYSWFLYSYIAFPEILDPGNILASILASANLKTADYAYATGTYSSQRNFATNVYKLVSDLSKLGVKFSYSLNKRATNRQSLALFVTPTAQRNFNTVIPIYFNDGHSYLLSESYDSDVCSCFIGYVPNSQTQNVYAYYLDNNLQIVQVPKELDNDDQITGYTKVDTCTSLADASTKAAAAFAANTWKHKVEFASDKEFHLRQPVKLMLERGVLSTAISKVEIKYGDDRYFYTCGDLPQTAAQHIKANSWSYGQRLPHNPYTGQLVFM